MSPVTYYIHTDQVGRPQKMTDGSANLVWDAVYDPFGNVTSLSGTATNLLMFPGQLYDSETALAQNWNREYDSTLGRYIQSDPIGLLGGINTYAYVNSNPLSYTDVYGLWPLGAPKSGFNFGGVHVPSEADVIAQIAKALEQKSICSEDATKLATDMVDEIGWRDLSFAQNLYNSLQSGTPLTQSQKQSAQNFINRLPSSDGPVLRQFLDGGAR